MEATRVTVPYTTIFPQNGQPATTYNVVVEASADPKNPNQALGAIVEVNPLPEGVNRDEIPVVGASTTIATRLVQPSSSTLPEASGGPPKPPKTTTPLPTNPNPTVTPSPVAAKSGPNTGAIVGAAVGCLIGGALLGFVIAFFLYRKRSQKQGGYTPPTVVESKAYDTPPPPAPVDNTTQLSKFLLDAVPDKEIAAELRSLGTLIQQHVENNYHTQAVQADPRSLEASLTQLGIGTGAVGGSLTPEVIAQLALEPRTRQVALQHVISQVVFTSVDVNSRSQLSMLPAPVAAFLQSIPPRESGEKNSDVQSIALNQWRALSAFLLHPSRSQRTPLPASNAAVSPQAAGLADALDTFLGYFVLPGDDDSRYQQKTHLQAVITECAKLGYVLLSQPSEWRFVHSSAGQSGRVAVVCAGLVKVTQKDGTPYGAPRQVVSPMSVGV